MSKFCISCGTQLEDDAEFCTICGAKQNNVQAAADASQAGGQVGMNMSDIAQAAGNMAQSASEAVRNTFDGVSVNSIKDAMSMDDIKNVGKTKNKNTIIGLAAIGVVVVILIIVLVSLLGKSPYEKPIDNLMKAIEKSDGKALKEAFPDYLNEFNEDHMDDDDYDSVEEYYEDIVLEEAKDSLEDDYGDNVKLKYKVIKKKEIKKSDLNDLEDNIETFYDESVDIDKGYRLKVELTVKGKEDKDSDNTWIEVYKIDGKWSIDNVSAIF